MRRPCGRTGPGDARRSSWARCCGTSAGDRRDRLGRDRPAVHGRGVLGRPAAHVPGRRPSLRAGPGRGPRARAPPPPYEVLLDGERVWPLADSPFPPSPIRTPRPGRAGAGRLRLLPVAPPPRSTAHDPVGADALDTLARGWPPTPTAERPDVLLLLGDQVYADETSQATQAAGSPRGAICPSRRAARSRTTRSTPGSTTSPGSTPRSAGCSPPSPLHDLRRPRRHRRLEHQRAWRQDMRATAWWQERILSGLMSYWVHQHLGNLSPAELADDALYAGSASCRAARTPRRCCAPSPPRPTPTARGLPLELPARLRPDPAADGRHPLRAGPRRRPSARCSTTPRRLAARAASSGDYDHLLIGTSLPWLLPPRCTTSRRGTRRCARSARRALGAVRRGAAAGRAIWSTGRRSRRPSRS